MTASTLVVAVAAPKVSSQRLIADMANTCQHRDFDIVEITPDGSTATPAVSRSIRYRLRTPLSTALDRLISIITSDDEPSTSIRLALAVRLRQRLRPKVQKLDRVIWPFTTAAERRRLLAELEALISSYDRAYLIYTDAWALPQAIELAQSIAFDGSGSTELFEMISENAGNQRMESS